jgi:hypothetical protein
MFILALAAPLRAGQIDAPVSGDFMPGTSGGAVGSSLGAPTPVQLTVPSLTGTGAPTLASNLAPAPVFLPAAVVLPAAAKAEPVPVLPVSVVLAAVPAAVPAALAEHSRPAASAPEAAADEKGLAEGAALFDQAKPSLWTKLVERLPFGERAPAWPGKAGDVVRIGRVKTTLERRAGDGGTSTVWQSRDRQFAIKLLHPQALDVPGVRDEASVLRAVASSDLPVAKLYAESKDGRVLVKEFIEGATARELLAAGAFSRPQAEGWPELAAKLIRAGVTADLANGNLIWQHWRSRWVVADAGGLTDGRPSDVLKQLATPELLKNGLGAADFLSGLRARLGPGSARWAATAADIRADAALAHLRPALDGLGARSAGAPALVFSPAPKAAGGLDDSVTTRKEVVKRLGFDPFLSKTKVKLHGEDPGKLNTVLLSIEEPGKPKIVMKTAAWDIIRNEAAGRRLARRFFGRYFRVPASLSVQDGYDSFMVMEKADASPSYYQGAFTLEQRVALALFIRTFGISDVNQGNVLAAHGDGLPWLIDFEQAFGRADPATGKHLPDERIAQEKPWMSLQVRNRIEDYQPAIAAWRAALAEPASRKGIEGDLLASGFTPAEAAWLLARFDLNAADLDWTLQNDADFVNQFVDRKAAQR